MKIGHVRSEVSFFLFFFVILHVYTAMEFRNRSVAGCGRREFSSNDHLQQRRHDPKRYSPKNSTGAARNTCFQLHAQYCCWGARMYVCTTIYAGSTRGYINLVKKVQGRNSKFQKVRKTHLPCTYSTYGPKWKVRWVMSNV